MQKVICFGEALIDLLSNKVGGQSSEHETFTKFAGGAPANVSVALAKLGGNSYFCGMLGDDMFGHFLKETLDFENVNTDYVFFTDEAKTALAFVSLDDKGERSFEFYRPPAADLCFSAEHFQAQWFESTGIFHFCSNSLTEPSAFDATQAGLTFAKNNRWLISFDVNLRFNLWQKNTNPRQRIQALLPQADVIKLAKEELLYLADQNDPEQAVAQILQAGSRLVLVTDGGKPLRWYTSSSSGTITPEKIQMVDATAAGDAFMGGVLQQLSQLSDTQSAFEKWLQNPIEMEKALRFASRCGAYAAAHKGAFPSLPTAESIQHFFENKP